jgi:succinate dehydrogenase / fumarate reductase iron-sulfur subunit
MRIRVARGYGVKSTAYQNYEVPDRPGQTVLEALLYVHDNLDDTLAFRYSCRGAVCGSCGMLINRVPRLACRTQLASLLLPERIHLKTSVTIPEGGFEIGKEALIEPLPNLERQKDLMVDMAPFFKAYKVISPYLFEGKSRDNLMDKPTVKELERFTNCVLCAVCYSSCPINGSDPDYLGPAALAKLYRFVIDPRDSEGMKRLGKADTPTGWRGCKFHANCAAVCPKGVPPNHAIAKARKMIEEGATGSRRGGE